MKKFNKDKALNKLNRNKNKKNIKVLSVLVSVCVLVGAIIFFSFARFESNHVFNLMDGNATLNISQYLKTINSNNLVYDSTLGDLGTEDNNLRYIGATPNNYVYYNCSKTNPEEMNDSTCEKWRIIGVFNNVEDESGNTASRVKIMRNDSLGNYSWDTSESNINSGLGINQWGPSVYKDGNAYEGSDLMRELNNDYLGTITVGTNGRWYNGKNDKKTASRTTKTINTYSQNMIQTVKWYLGANNDLDINKYTPYLMYKNERSNYVNDQCSNDELCDDEVVRTESWIGKIGLAYVSDYGYSTSGGDTYNREFCLNYTLYNWNDFEEPECVQNSWFNVEHMWFINPEYNNENATKVFIKDNDGFSLGDNVSSVYNVFPTLYLKNNVIIISGDGSESNPYKLKI